jgi:hypothetical protein
MIRDMRFLSCVLLLVSSCAKPHPASDPPTSKPTASAGAKPQKVLRTPRDHRAEAEACPKDRPPGTPRAGNPGCKSDAECKEAKNGRCNARGGGHEAPVNACEYDRCSSDADCGAHGVCVCEGSGNYCVNGDCSTDADCPGATCSPQYGCRGGIGAYYCHTQDDTCTNNDDCSNMMGKDKECQYSPELGHWACIERMCPVG